MTVKCPHCETEQAVRVAVVKLGVLQVSPPQSLSCINIQCKKDFDVMIPHRIIAGPFPV
jgi:hypothetical protein